MAVSKSFVNNPENIRLVVDTYIGVDKPTYAEVALRVGTTTQNVRACLRMGLTPEKRKAEKSLRYSRSKIGQKNPMQGKNGFLHHNYVGVIFDGNGYLQIKIDGKYVLMHRHIMAQALGLPKLPPWLDVHHIDKDKTNNDLDNLALVTRVGHRKLHATLPEYEKSPLWEQWVSGISKLQETTPTLHMDL